MTAPNLTDFYKIYIQAWNRRSGYVKMEQAKLSTSVSDEEAQQKEEEQLNTKTLKH
jgi:hypothetical protein